MSTVIDRLEALAERNAEVVSLEWEEQVEIIDALPDLLEVARAAKELLDDLKDEQDWDDDTPLELALKPLFRELPS